MNIEYKTRNMSSYKKTQIKSITEFIEVVEEIKKTSEENGNNTELLFRGQSIDKPLLPKLSRLNLNGDIKTVERLILDEFKRGIVPLSEFKPENDWDLLALAQHHGLPTRLLDWSYSSLIALWFAVSEAPIKKEKGGFENGVVWVLNADTGDFKLDAEIHGPLSNKITKIYRPKVISRRISAQAGAFSVHKINDDDYHIIRFELNKRYGSKLTKITIPSNLFAGIRKSLNLLGINNATVYPDLDGFCRHLEKRFSKQSDE